MIGQVHEVIVRDISDLIPDAEGRWTADPADERVWGSVDEVSAREILIGAQSGQRSDVVVRLDLSVDVTDAHLIEVVTPARMAGLYRVDDVRTLRTHLRALCSKTTIRDWAGGHP